VHVDGHWQAKGAYYLAKLGPTFRYRQNERWAVSGSAGLALGFVGTVFRADEMVVEDLGLPQPLRISEKNSTQTYIPGYYGTLNAEYWVTERTGFYLGINYQDMRGYSQKPLSGRTLRIDVGSSSGWQMGVMTRF